MIERKKKIMMMLQESVLDTSPVILEYDKRYNAIIISSEEGSCITGIYYYPQQTYAYTLVTNGVRSSIVLYTDGVFKDYWNWFDTDGYNRKVLNIGSNEIKFTLTTSKLNESYAYLQETGQIIFAGQNSIYYGHTNISELS